jgi:hypothetical protein
MIGGAILPSLLHQDPRYFYQGTGTNKSRALHALTSPFVCRGDNGQWQPNYSTIGGDLASAAISNAYYPASNRGVGLFLSNFLIGTSQRAAANLAQEFIAGSRTKPRTKSKYPTAELAALVCERLKAARRLLTRLGFRRGGGFSATSTSASR